jgi:hypothetical protein
MNWKIIFIAGLLLLLAGVSIGFVGGGFTPQSREMVLRQYIGELGAHFLLYAAVFVWLGYRQRRRPIAHAVMALLVASTIAMAMMAAITNSFSLSTIERSPLLLVAIDWGVTIAALASGLLVGCQWAKRRRAELPRREA